MPPQQKWNKLSIIAAVLFVVAWIGANFINHIVWLITSEPMYGSSREAGISGLFEWLGVISPHILIAVLAFIAIRKIKITREKGKILSWIILALAILSILLWTTTSFLRNSNLRELFTGDPASQYTSGLTDAEEEVSRTQGRDTIKYSDMMMIRTSVQEFHIAYGRYPLDKAEIVSKGTSIYRKDWNVEYLSIDSGRSYVLRTQLESDSLGRLNGADDKDGMQGSLDCSDASRYLCYTP